jgi:glycosyltransferase involved in cell wall biosynthesis
MGDIPLKIAFVVQRYGQEVTGGAEKLCRLLAEHLAAYWDIEVITTCARDYITWKDFYPAGREKVNGITVWRFPVDQPRKIRWFNLFSRKILDGQASIPEEIEWMRRQGPFSTPLFNFIETHRDEYHYFIYFTYLYCTTYFGLPLVPEKSILVPTAHDEPPIYLKIFRPLFHLPRAIIYNSQEEQNFVQEHFKNQYIPHRVCGLGVDIPPEEKLSPSPNKSPLPEEDYLLYIGRIDINKGCKELVEFFRRYQSKKKVKLKLVLVGQKALRIPSDPNLLSLGYLPEEEKNKWLSHATLVVIPSPYESLSLTLLEAYARGIPVLVNGTSKVLKGHCLRSGAGFWYHDYAEFAHQLDRFLSNRDLREYMSESGKKYIKENYTWDIIEKRYLSFIGHLGS